MERRPLERSLPDIRNKVSYEKFSHESEFAAYFLGLPWRQRVLLGGWMDGWISSWIDTIVLGINAHLGPSYFSFVAVSLKPLKELFYQMTQ